MSDEELQERRRPPESADEAEAAIEAMLFAAGEALPLSRIAKALGHDADTTRKLLQRLSDTYRAKNRGLRIVELEQSYQLCTKQEYYEYLIRLTLQPQTFRLTDVMLETLAIIAYRQPVTKLEIEKIRGVKSDHAVNRLVEYRLVEELGRLDAPGRPILFGTTEEFLRYFGVSSTDMLPQISPVKLEDLRAEVEEEMQEKLDL